jgi:polyferredoxin
MNQNKYNWKYFQRFWNKKKIKKKKAVWILTVKYVKVSLFSLILVFEYNTHWINDWKTQTFIRVYTGLFGITKHGM